jgi:hypothetical protein
MVDVPPRVTVVFALLAALAPPARQTIRVRQPASAAISAIRPRTPARPG